MKKIIPVLVLILGVVFALTSCEHTHKFTGEWQSNDEGHYRVCDCLEESKVEPHIGGTATETERAVCTVCNYAYGDFKAPDQGNNGGDNGNEDNGQNNGGSTVPEQLSIPTVTVSKDGTASWTAVENATSYLYKIDGGALLRTYELSIKLNDGESITVAAESLDGLYLDSDFSASVTYTAPTALPAPQITVSESGVATWTPVENADGYVCILNGLTLPKITDTTINLLDGYSLSVKAVSGSDAYIDSPFSQTVTYIVAERLQTPVVSINKSGVVAVSTVANASGYTYKLNGAEFTVSSWQTLTLQDGDRISVKAIGNGAKYLDSEYSDEQIFVQEVTLNTPVVSIDKNGKASWSAVPNATGYVCKINGVESNITTALYVNLNENDTISVKAIGNGGKYLDSAYSQSLKYTKSSVSQNVVDFDDMLSVNGPLTDGCLPSVGNINVLVIPVNLDSSKKTNQLLSDIKTAFTGTSTATGWESVKTYYEKSSYGKLNFNFDVLNEWFTPSKNASYYNSYYDNATYADGSTLILDEALSYYDSKIDYTKYDNNDDGYIDAVWLIYNYDVDYESDDSIFWAFQSWSYSEEEYDGVGVYYYAFAGTDFMYEEDTFYDSENIVIDAHTYIHETGHLMGLDDFYDYDENTGAEGGYYTADMMDYNIGDHGSINKLLLNWIDPTVLTGKGEIEITFTSFTETGFVVLIANHSLNSIYDEYFLIEFYTSTGLNANDQPVYDGDSTTVYGIRILHVDANPYYNSSGELDLNGGDAYQTGFKYDNSDEDKLFVDTMCRETPDDFYATEEILYVVGGNDFGIDVYSNYKYHDGTSLNFTLEVVSMNQSSARVIITLK